MSATDQLISLLAIQREVLTRLLNLCNEERTCLLNSRLDRLEEITREQGSLLTAQANLSSRINRTLALLTTELQLSEQPALSCIARALSGPQADTVRAYHRELSAGAEELQREGRVNWYLAQQAMKYIDFTLRLIGTSKEGSLPYVPPEQQSRHRSMQLLMDTRA